MRRYIADLHFFHEGLNDRMDCRGFSSAQAMNEHMIQRWNSVVHKNDEVVILGDFSVGRAEDTNAVLRELKGKLYLISGNHDYYLTKSEFDASRFVWIKPCAQMHDNGRKVILCHYPIFCYPGQYRRTKKGEPCAYMLHGHVHNTLDAALLDEFQRITRHTPRPDGSGTIDCRLYNCFCMFSDYVPWSLEEWETYHEKRLAAQWEGGTNESHKI